jgi:hypothetical protein
MNALGVLGYSGNYNYFCHFVNVEVELDRLKRPVLGIADRRSVSAYSCDSLTVGSTPSLKVIRSSGSAEKSAEVIVTA